MGNGGSSDRSDEETIDCYEQNQELDDENKTDVDLDLDAKEKKGNKDAKKNSNNKVEIPPLDYTKELKELSEILDLDSYEVYTKRILGEGRMAIVVKGKHKKTQKIVAIKILNRRYYDETDAKYPPSELNILNNIRHPNIIAIFETIATEKFCYIISEIIHGEEFFDYLTRVNKLPETETIYFTRQMVAAIDFLHRNKICHRDLKAENLLIIKGEKYNGRRGKDDKEDYKNMTLKLIDFDLASGFDENSKLTDYCGSSDYAAPEVWKKDPYVGPEVDIWSLGVMIYVMITSFLPFNNRLAVIDCRWSWPSYSGFSPRPSTYLDRLLKKIFVPKETRCTMQQIIESEWLNTYNLVKQIVRLPVIEKEDRKERDEKDVALDIVSVYSPDKTLEIIQKEVDSLYQ